MVKQTPRRKSALSIGTEKKDIKELPQVPGTRKSVSRDLARSARVPGLRLSRNGKKYWETRENRSDKRGTKL